MRIVAGAAKGRRLAGPPDGTRPTSDRAREALFNTLAAARDLEGARVLDLYAGTGAVGLEALSRGARTAVFVERGRAALTVLRRNVETVARDGAQVVARPVARYLETPPDAPFDLVFADPPYARPDAEVHAVLDRLASPEWLAPAAFVVVERAAPAGVSGWAHDFITPAGEKRYGDSVFWYGRRR